MRTVNPNLAVIEARRAEGYALLADLTLNADLENEMRIADMKHHAMMLDACESQEEVDALSAHFSKVFA